MMYSTLEAFKLALDTASTEDDEELQGYLETVSRAVDRYCTKSSHPSANNYFAMGEVVDDILRGHVAHQGFILCYPHKPAVTAVESASYRYTPRESWTEVQSGDISFNGALKLWAVAGLPRGEVFVKASYTGGLFESPEEAPADFRDAVTLLAVRFYKETKSGLGDSIGVAELGTMVYTKAWPVRVVEMLQPYMRIIPWT